MTRPNEDCTSCVDLLNEALNLTVRGRTLDAIQNRQAARIALARYRGGVTSGE